MSAKWRRVEAFFRKVDIAGVKMRFDRDSGIASTKLGKQEALIVRIRCRHADAQHAGRCGLLPGCFTLGVGKQAKHLPALFEVAPSCIRQADLSCCPHEQAHTQARLQTRLNG